MDGGCADLFDLDQADATLSDGVWDPDRNIRAVSVLITEPTGPLENFWRRNNRTCDHTRRKPDFEEGITATAYTQAGTPASLR
jgi:hypothetical protein